FSKADLVVTDRLHGMLFSILTRRPCLVFANNNHKIESTISTWLQDVRSVKLVTPDSVTSVENQLKTLMRPSQDELLEIKQNYVP
ncbi:polysaccharide pyruvyl transferase family protein, partial [Bacillus paralicheniformis]